MHHLKLSTSHFLPHLSCQIEVDLKAGELRVLCGENGIGKSTLLKKIFEEYNEKKCIILSDQKPLEFFFDRTLSTFKKIILNSSSIQNTGRFEKFWKSSGLSEKETRFLSQLSGGESQLLKLITLCSAEAEIYLLDEPGQYLDREKRSLANQIFEELKSCQKSVLVIEHDYSWFSPGTAISELYVRENSLQEKKTWII